jgi:hypothetical protein
MALGIHPLWARSFFFLIFIPVEIDYQFKPDKRANTFFVLTTSPLLIFLFSLFYPTLLNTLEKAPSLKCPYLAICLRKFISQ